MAYHGITPGNLSVRDTIDIGATFAGTTISTQGITTVLTVGGTVLYQRTLG